MHGGPRGKDCPDNAHMRGNGELEGNSSALDRTVKWEKLDDRQVAMLAVEAWVEGEVPEAHTVAKHTKRRAQLPNGPIKENTPRFSTDFVPAL